MRSMWTAGQVIFVLALSSILETAYARLPDGFVLYDGHKTEFTIALPHGWTVHVQPFLAE